MSNGFQQLIPQNGVAFLLMLFGIIIFGISIGFVFLRIPSVKLPISDELYAMDTIKNYMPPEGVNGASIVRDKTKPFSQNIGGQDVNQYKAEQSINTAFNKSDFNILYNNYLKPTLESMLLNNQTLIINKTDKVADITISLCFAFLGLTFIYISITLYIKESKDYGVTTNTTMSFGS